MKWIKASERKVESAPGQKVIIKYKGKPDLLLNYRGTLCWYDDSRITTDDYKVEDDSWSAIEWLDESTPSLQSFIARARDIASSPNDHNITLYESDFVTLYNEFVSREN